MLISPYKKKVERIGIQLSKLVCRILVQSFDFMYQCSLNKLRSLVHIESISEHATYW